MEQVSRLKIYHFVVLHLMMFFLRLRDTHAMTKQRKKARRLESKVMLKASFNPNIQSEKRSKLFWALSDSWVLAKRSIKHITRNLDQLFSVALFPMMFFLLFRYVFGGAIDTGDISYVNFLVAGIFVQMLAFGANYTTMNLAIDLQRGIVNRFRSLPIARSALLIGHVGADLVRNTISGLIVIGVSFLVGFQPVACPMHFKSLLKTSLLHMLLRQFALGLSGHQLAILVGLHLHGA